MQALSQDPRRPLSNLRLVTDAVHEDDALCLRLAYRPLRDALWTRSFPRQPVGDADAGIRLRSTRKAALVATVARGRQHNYCRGRQGADTWMCCSGRGRKAVAGAGVSAITRQKVATLRRCSGWLRNGC
jgi:hypothetical protein